MLSAIRVARAHDGAIFIDAARVGKNRSRGGIRAIDAAEHAGVQQEAVAGLPAVGRGQNVIPHHIAQITDAVGVSLRCAREPDAAVVPARQPESQTLPGGADVPAHDDVAVVDAVGHGFTRVRDIYGCVSE